MICPMQVERPQVGREIFDPRSVLDSQVVGLTCRTASARIAVWLASRMLASAGSKAETSAQVTATGCPRSAA